MDINDVFERRQRVSTHWWNKSNDLFAAAAAVWDSMDPDSSARLVKRFEFPAGFDMRAAVPDVFRMLCGMSLELLFKALLVRAGTRVPHTHDLAKLAALADFVASAEEQGLLAILSEAIKWGGRYPVPKERATWEDLSSLEMTHLYTSEPLGNSTFSIARPNRALSWDGFSTLRDRALAGYAHPGL